MVLLAVTVTVVLGGGASRALAASLACGDTITQDTILQADLTDCPGDGLVIGAPGVTLDLDGHVVDGDETAPTFADPDVGISSAGHDGVIIRGGTVRGFDVGVFIRDSENSRILQVTAASNARQGLAAYDFSGGRLARNSTVDNDIGIDISGGDGNRVDHNRVERNGLGLWVTGVERTRVEANAMVANSQSLLITGYGGGGPAAVDNIVQRNIILADAHAWGIAVSADRSRVRNNLISGPHQAVTVYGDGNRVIQNRIIGKGPEPEGCFGNAVDVWAGQANVVAHNRITNTCGSGIRLAPLNVTVDTKIIANVVRHAGAHGIAVEQQEPVNSDAVDTTLDRNIVIGSARNGIKIDSPTTVLTRNLARDNADLGIEAVSGVVDGGGNSAFGNGDPAQCVNVLCPP